MQPGSCHVRRSPARTRALWSQDLDRLPSSVRCDPRASDRHAVVVPSKPGRSSRSLLTSTRWAVNAILGSVVNILLSITFSCGLIIAIAHVANTKFIAPVYDVVANLTAFASAVAASALLGHWIPATLSAVAFLCWLVLGRRTQVSRRG